MILVESASFGFMHIPKCAGSTFRQQLLEVNDLADFYGITELPGHGSVVRHHLPLAVLEELFPEILERLGKVSRYAMVRDPSQRFRSSVAQFTRAHLGREPSEMSKSEIVSEVMRIIDALTRPGPAENAHLASFQRQCDFIFLGDLQFVDNLYPFDDVDRMVQDIQRRHGLRINHRSAYNQTVTYRVPLFSKPIKYVRGVASRTLPPRAYEVLRDIALATLAKKGAPVLEDALQSTDEIEAFLKSYYARDFDLYASVSAARAPA